MVSGAWQVVPDASAAGGARMWSPDKGLAKLAAPAAAPADYFELTFTAEAGTPYRIWMRGRADRDSWTNDSAFFQFSGSVTAAGAPTFRIGSSSATWLGVEDCSGCAIHGWGWQDNGYGAGVLGPVVYFAASGPQTLRVQRREDGLSIDQIVLSPVKYLTMAPGAVRDDATIVPQEIVVAPPSVAESHTEVVIAAASATRVEGVWKVLADATAAGGVAVGNPDAGAAKPAAASASPVSYVEFSFTAEAGTPYRLWLRGRAERDSWASDSVFVQFDGSVTQTGLPIARTGSKDSFSVNLEDGVNAGVSGWGWQDNGYGAAVLGPVVFFETTGPQTIRIQAREDGMRIDQIVLSADKYLTAAPGALKNDGTILK